MTLIVTDAALEIDMSFVPTWFDVLSIGLSLIATLVPSFLAIALWQREYRERRADRHKAAVRLFSTRVETLGDNRGVFAALRYLPELLHELGEGSTPLYMLLMTELHLADHGGSDREIDTPIDMAALAHAWLDYPEDRANKIEVLLAHGDIALDPADNLLITPTAARRVEKTILSNRSYRLWVKRTRLSATRIRLRRVRLLLMFWKRPNPAGNTFATKDWVFEDEVVNGDDWYGPHIRVLAV